MAAARFSRLSLRSLSNNVFPMTASFVIQGTTSQTVLIRALGPSLAKLGIYGVLQHPKIILSQGGAGGVTVIATGGPWGSAPVPGKSPVSASAQPATADLMSRASLSALPSGSADAALVATLPPGVYTVQTPPADSAAGAVQVEICDIP